jgi:AraC family transcriptional regulator of adaptative response/methylated-DNA-[protein]-cysteine methyltransferase
MSEYGEYQPPVDLKLGAQSATRHMIAASPPATSRASRRTARLGSRRAPARTSESVGRDEIAYTLGQTPLGLALVATSSAGVSAIFLGDDRPQLEGAVRARFRTSTVVAATAGADAGADALRRRVISHLGAPAGAIDVPLDLRGTPFQQQVWRELRRIPAGQTATYAQIAERIGRPEAVRAVASAIGANPVAVVVPCHRVVRSDGSLSGYRWGVERKRALLARERVESGV